MSGDFIQVEANLLARNQWLEVNREAVAPYLIDGRECTIFTFSRDEPTDRATTRIGGLPYWPAGQPWPVCSACSLVTPQPMMFTAQVDFRQSPLHSDLPGDVLSFHYCISCQMWDCREADRGRKGGRRADREVLAALPDGLTYAPGGGALTWHRVHSAGATLITEADIPRVEGSEEWAVEPYYGTPQPATDYPTPDEAYDDEIAGESYTYLQFTLQGTKIGGHPPPIQEVAMPKDSAGQPMRFLGAIGSIQSGPVDGDDGSYDKDFTWGDMGSLCFWISDTAPAAEMAWAISSY